MLIDFAAARLHKLEAEADTQILGTTGFAAPEQYGLSQSDTPLAGNPAKSPRPGSDIPER